MKTKIAVFLGLFLLVALAGSLGLAVWRVQNQKNVLQRPRAEGSCGNPPACCNDIAAGKGFDSCSWDPGGRGWCTLEQCAGSDSNKTYACNAGGGPRNCNCGLFVRTYCNAPSNCGGKTCSSGQTCRDGVCVTPNPCWTNQPIPKSWNESTLSWDWDTTYSSTFSYVNVYVWTDSARTGNAYSTAAAKSADGFKSVKVSDFSPALRPNTTYYVKVNPNGYNSPDAAHQCMDTATAGWTFTTGGGGGGARSCSVSIVSTSGTGASLQFSGSGAVGENVEFYVTKKDGAAISVPPAGSTLVNNCGENGKNCYKVGSCATNGSSCNGSASVNLPAGDYVAFCGVPKTDYTGGCSGNPFCTYNGGLTNCGPTWVSCGADHPGFTVAAVAGCVDSQCNSDQKCVNNQCATFSCDPQTCKSATAANHTCQYTNLSDGTACGAAGSGNTCQNGVCTTASCPSGQTSCSGVCKNLQTDPANCGTCGNACTTGQTCVNSVCTLVNNEVNSCWGNSGTNGKCYDCNGDGVVNILDYSCFARKWQQNVQ